MPSSNEQVDPPACTAGKVELDQLCDNPGPCSSDPGDERGSAAAEGDELEDRAMVTAFVAALVDGALEPLEDWLQEARTSPEAEHRCIDAALVLSSYADSLYKRVYG